MFPVIVRQIHYAPFIRIAAIVAIAWGLVGSSYAGTLVNTAAVQYKIGSNLESAVSNRTELPLLPKPIQATVTLFQHDPNGLTLPAEEGMFYAADGTLTALPPPKDQRGNNLPANPASVREAELYQTGEPVFIQVKDLDFNVNPNAREFVEVTVTTSTGDREILRLLETGLNTGIFFGVIQGDDKASATHADGRLHLPHSSTVTVRYQDPFFPEISEDKGLVDPFGTVFDSQTGQPVNGAIVRLVDAKGHPAIVFGDDGTSTYPATVITGPASAPPGPSNKPDRPNGTISMKAVNNDLNGNPSEVVDSSGRAYPFPPGQFRFPLVAPGIYRLDVTPPEGYAAPSSVSKSDLLKVKNPAGRLYALHETGSLGQPFEIKLGAPVNIDIPIDSGRTPLLLTKMASKQEVSAGDFLQYTLTLENRDTASAAGITVTDQLPLGMRFEPGSLRKNGLPLPDPSITPDGQTLTFTIGDMAANEKVSVAYVVMASAGIRPGEATNRAIARDVANRTSNRAEAVVRVREPFMTNDFTIIGRVVQGEEGCRTPWEGLHGVPQIRLLMEDGASVMTDADGYYHFRGVRSGTHVVQLDRASLPLYLTAIPCIDNTRFAGNPFSQFVEAQGGALWRADFYLGPTAPLQEGFVGVNLEGVMTPEKMGSEKQRVTHQLDSKALFTTLSAKPRQDGLRAMSAFADKIRKMPIDHIEVIGHTDSRVIHRVKQRLFRDNYDLSWARAQSISDYLIKTLNLPPQKIKSIGRGADQPVATNRTREGRAKNRRVDVVVYLADEIEKKPVGLGRRFRYRVAADGGPVPVKNVRVLMTLPPGVSYIPQSTQINGVPASDPRIDGNTLSYPLNGVEKNWKQYIELQGWIPMASLPQDHSGTGRDFSCPENGFIGQTLIFFETEAGRTVRTPTVRNTLLCPPLDTTLGFADHSPLFIAKMSDRQAATIMMLPVPDPTPPPSQEDRTPPPLSDSDAAGGGKDWLTGQSPGVAWLFPGWDHNPRSPSLRIIIKHAPGQNVVLTHQDQPVDPLYRDISEANDTVAVAMWRGVPLVEGRNMFRASIYNARGHLVNVLTRLVHYASQPVRVELVSEQSVLIADGIQKPIIAVRLLDRDNHPVHAGMTGTYTVNAPYLPAATVDGTQARQLAGTDRFRPTFVVSGDEGIAPIELAPTLSGGTVVVTIYLQNGGKERVESLRAFIAPALRDWVVVGFAEGDVGYNTLSGNMQPLTPKDQEEGLVTDGNIRLYAKGRVLGKWLLTVAYDSDKSADARDATGLFSGIDPDQFYTLYGDTTEPVYDAASRKKLYLKLSRDQFYILFGDYDTDLTQTRLARYNRTFTGVKTEYHGPVLDLTAYAAETDLHFAKDEIQGNGTSGLYPLSKRNIVINSEKVKIETRDRLKSEQIVQVRSLIRHLDYDIDYIAGTLFFREPIQSRDTHFNPIFIVVDYETLGPSGEVLVNAGGRVGAHLLDEHLILGASQIRDETFSGKSDLTGLDLTAQLGSDSRLRMEGAMSNGFVNTQDLSGSASLIEWEHHGQRSDMLAYWRRQTKAFGVGQQSGSEAGTQKEGVEGRLHLTKQISWDTELSRQENLPLSAHRDLGKMQLRHQTDFGSLHAGVAFAEDNFEVGGTVLRSEQATLGASHLFMDKALEVQVTGEFPLGNSHQNESLDFPLRSRLGINYAVTDSIRLLMAHEIADGDAFRTSTTRAGFQAVPWKGMRLTQTLNQSQISEHGPRTFGAFGLTQSFLISQRWGFDLSADSNRTFKESGTPPPVFNGNHPIAFGGMIGEGPPPEDFVAVSGGVTYRTEQWSWNARLEDRNAEKTDRYGISTNFLRQTQAGIAFGLSVQAFQMEDVSSQTKGLSQDVSLSWAYRPVGASVSVLDRLEFRRDAATRMTPALASLGLPLLGDSRRLINNVTLNRVSRFWTGDSGASGEKGRFYRNQRNQWSLYYGSKYVLDQIDQRDYKGYTDMTGLEWRYDVTRRVDVGLQTGMLHSWKAKNYSYMGGPSVGLSPVDNGWITLGYNVVGFYDRDFRDAGYTRQGPFLRLRLKFDEKSLGKQ